MVVGFRNALKSSSFHSGTVILGLIVFVAINCRLKSPGMPWYMAGNATCWTKSMFSS